MVVVKVVPETVVVVGVTLLKKYITGPKLPKYKSITTKAYPACCTRRSAHQRRLFDLGGRTGASSRLAPHSAQATEPSSFSRPQYTQVITTSPSYQFAQESWREQGNS